VNFSAAALDRHREKWREAPRGSDTDGRVFSSDLLALSDDAFLATWDGMAARRYTGEIGWLGAVYGDTFRGRRILELGSGLGFDGIRFAQLGAVWTFADIVPDNLAVIRRVADLKCLSSVTFHLIGDDLSFAALPADFDAIWVFGSIHHVPFEIAATRGAGGARASAAWRPVDGTRLSSRKMVARGCAALQRLGPRH
jgi:SAM-dependent methyltransferase